MQITAPGLGAIIAVAGLVGCGGGAGSGGAAGTAGRAEMAGNGGGQGIAGSPGTAGSGAGGAFTTGLGSGTKLSGLSGGQATQLCSDFNAYLQKTLVPTYSCKLAGVFGAISATGGSDADLQAACAVAYNACMALDGGVPTSGCTTSNLLSNSATCVATVGDLTTCLDDQGNEYAQLPRCSVLTAASLAGLTVDGGALSGPASCAIFESGGTCSDGVAPAGGTTN